jgi:hypothetical protein
MRVCRSARPAHPLDASVRMAQRLLVRVDFGGAKVRTAVFAFLFALVACVACGKDEQAGAPTPSAEQAPPAPASREETIAALKASYVWGGSGPARDLDADFESCDPARQEGPKRTGMAAFAEGMRCMEAKGWKIKPADQ